jgi:hypothetical protein
LMTVPAFDGMNYGY